jgi:hypothetical protein
MTVLQHWVIYDHPSDFPGHMVVRCLLVGPGTVEATDEIWLRDTLAQAREVVSENYPEGFRLDRQPGDDPVIVEVWV